MNVGRPGERAQAERFVAEVLATDEHGNRYALARRMGVMYMIWNQRIWSAYRASEGWRPYHGASPHTDHVHISLSWAGAQARTSFWSGNVVEVLLASSPTGAGGRPGSATLAARPASSTRTRGPVTTVDPGATERHRAEWQARRAEAEARRKAAAEEAAADEAARRQEWEAEQVARRERAAERHAQALAEEAERRAAEEEARRQEWERRQAELQKRQQSSTTTTTAPKPTTTTTAPKPTTTTTAPRPTTTTTAPKPTTTTTAPKPKPTTTTTTAPKPKPTTTTTAPKPTTTTAPTTSTSTTAAE